MHAFAHSRRACSAYLFSNIWNVERIFLAPIYQKRKDNDSIYRSGLLQRKKATPTPGTYVREVRTRALAAHGGHRDING
jgi:hypothetical protein